MKTILLLISVLFCSTLSASTLDIASINVEESFSKIYVVYDKNGNKTIIVNYTVPSEFVSGQYDKKCSLILNGQLEVIKNNCGKQ